jgi:hypothetical protein
MTGVYHPSVTPANVGADLGAKVREAGQQGEHGRFDPVRADLQTSEREKGCL